MVKRFTSAFLVLLYLNVTVGIAIHECGCGNSGKLEMFMSEKNCVCHKSECNDPTDSKHDCKNHHDEHDADDDHAAAADCHCKTEYKTACLDGTLIVTGQFSSKNFAMLAVATLEKTTEQIVVLPSERVNFSPPAAKKPPLIYSNCQLRL